MLPLGAQGGRVELALTPLPDGVRFTVRVQPRAARSGLAGLYGDALKVALNAPPVDGAANVALIALLAELLDVPRSSVTIRAGQSARSKLIEVRGVSVEQARARLLRS